MITAIAARVPGRGAQRARRSALAWWALAWLAFVLLPWYLPQNLTLLGALAGVFGGAEIE